MGLYVFRLEATGPFGLRGRTFFRLLHCCHWSHRWINRLVQGVGHPFATAVGVPGFRVNQEIETSLLRA
jgi:hypothetical protein